LIGWDRPAYSEQNICARRSEYDCRQLLVQPAFAEKVPVCAECATALEAQTCDQWLDRAPAVCNAPANSPDYSACHSNVKIWASKESYDPGETIVINFSGASGYPLDWIGLYHFEERPRATSLLWKYVANNKQTYGGVATSGQITLDSTSVHTMRGYWPLTSGKTYTAFFLLNDGYRNRGYTTLKIN
jgi:hypothetical protein